MTDGIFYIFDRTSNHRKVIRYCRKKDIGKVFLCPITTEETVISFITGQLVSSAGSQVEVVPYLEYFNKLAFSERKNFIDFISKFAKGPRFGKMNFKEYFKYPGSSFSVWWSSLIFEKNPQKSDVYHNLIQLFTILKLRKEYGCRVLILDIESKELSCTIMQNSINGRYDCRDFKKHRMHPQFVGLLINFLKGIKHYLYFLYKIVIVTISARGLDFRREILRNARYLAISYFPLTDKESLKQEKFVNKYYGLLQSALQNKYKGRFIWLAMSPGINNFSFKDSAELGRQINIWKYPIYFLEEWITLKDLFMILTHYVYFTMKCSLKVPYVSRSFEYKNVRLWNIFRQDWFSSFAGGSLMSGIFYLRAFKNIADELKRGAIVTYLAENHDWERILNFAFHDKKDFKTIGILHTTVPLLFLPFFDSKDDLQQNGETGLAMPMPDYLACNGRIPWKIFREAGWSERKAFLWFAIRYQYLKRHLKEKFAWEKRENKILVILSRVDKESKELLRYIYQAFNTQVDYQIVIKAHYALAPHLLIRNLDLDFNKDIFVFSDEDLERLLPFMKAMVVTGSSAALEGIAFGCPVIVPRLSSVVDMNPLSEISDLAIYAQSPRQLRDIVGDIVSRKEPPLTYEKCRDFVENYLEFSNSEDELVEKMEAQFASVHS